MRINTAFTAGLLFIACTTMIIFHPTYHSLFGLWTTWDESMSHGLLTTAAAFYFVFTDTGLKYKEDSLSNQLLTFGLLVGLAIFWLLFNVAGIEIITQLILFIIIITLVGTVFSISTIASLLIPLSILIYSVPVWQYFNNSLVILSSSITSFFVKLIGLTAFIEGNSITIPYGVITIADGCSGLRYFTTAMALGHIVGYTNRRGMLHILQMIAIFTALGLVTNWVRIFILILTGYNTEMESSLMSDHELFGWVLFSIIMLPAIYLCTKKPPENQKTPQNIPFKPVFKNSIISLCCLLIPTVVFGLISQPNITLDQQLANKLADRHDSPMGIIKPDSFDSLNIKDSNPFTGTYRIEFTNLKTTRDEKMVPYFRSLLPDHFIQRGWHKEGRIFEDVIERDYYLVSHQYRIGTYSTSSYRNIKLYQVVAFLKNQHEFVASITLNRCSNRTCSDL